MASNNHPQRAFYALFEELIQTTKIVEFYPFNETLDFIVGNVVECSYMKGFYKVIATNDTYLTIIPVGLDEQDERNFAYVGPTFLRKILVNEQVIRILFNATD